MITTVLFRLSPTCRLPLVEKSILTVFSFLLLVSDNTWSQCCTLTATIDVQRGYNTFNGQPPEPILSNTAAGTIPFGLTFKGNAYNDIAPPTVVAQSSPTAEKLWPVAPEVIPPTNEDTSITLGVKFSSSVSGYVRGVRFFSSNDAVLSTGSYTGQLWSVDGTLLASDTFSNVTSSDWQELVFATPVLISANTTYVASYHTNGTKYVGTAGGFASTRINGSLTALDNLSSGGNGVFAYGATASFPGNSVGANYWVDVIFATDVFTGDLH